MPDTLTPEVEAEIEEQWSGSDVSFLHWTSCASARYEDGTCDCSAREAIMRFARNVAIVARRAEIENVAAMTRHHEYDEEFAARVYTYLQTNGFHESNDGGFVRQSPAAPVAPAATREVLAGMILEYHDRSHGASIDECAATLCSQYIAAVRAEASGETET